MFFSALFQTVFPLRCSIPATSASSIFYSTRDASRPIVELDYGTFRGAYSPEYDLTYYRKIPFAAPPTGYNRFRAPQPPLAITNGVYDTDQSFDLCPNFRVRGNEDCLYLGVYSRPWDRQKTPNLRPVLVTFFNGGFIGLNETWNVPPAGFPVLNVSSQNDYLIVYANHRTSVLGYLASAKLADRSDVDLNRGLLDEQAALVWVQKYIHEFGGDKHNVTIWGQSSSAGDMVVQAIATGNQGKNLFSRVMANSPLALKLYPYDSNFTETLYQHTLEYVGCANATDEIACLKEVDVQLIRDSGAVLVNDLKYKVATFTFFAVIDGKFLAKPLSEVVESGSLNADALMFSYNLHEGENSVPPGFADATTSPSDGFNSSAASFDQWLKEYFPDLTTEDLDNIKKIYPEMGGDEAITWNTTLVRASLVYRDNVISCPAYWLARKAKRGYLIENTIPPARHVSDAEYWNLVNPVQQSDSLTYQGYVGAMASFVQTGDANAHKITNESVPGLPKAKQNNQFLLTPRGLEQGGLSIMEERCAFWLSIAKRLPV